MDPRLSRARIALFQLPARRSGAISRSIDGAGQRCPCSRRALPRGSPALSPRERSDGRGARRRGREGDEGTGASDTASKRASALHHQVRAGSRANASPWRQPSVTRGPARGPHLHLE
ncbi:hypothetical protein NDU88_001457 [Pleurodeles waltl]|uniref:Uncharacterized protein n=1 Tax=Pleurodeles waltl TaxID=8319 RepID=A0AAV7SZ93_PLEWA|nr:hypothetical protein NDU88_001457 [Pleurodeles waltl]